MTEVLKSTERESKIMCIYLVMGAEPLVVLGKNKVIVGLCYRKDLSKPVKGMKKHMMIRR